MSIQSRFSLFKIINFLLLHFRRKSINELMDELTLFHGSPGAYMGRYRIISGPPVHKSKTCTLVFAEDLTTNERVALKIMLHRHQFVAEIEARHNRGNPLSADYIITLLGWHCPSDDSISDEGGRTPLQEATEKTEDGAATYVLVMPQGERSLHDACAKERIAGIDADAVVGIMQQVGGCLRYLHSMGVVHMDVKPRNIIRLTDGRVILCDMVRWFFWISTCIWRMLLQILIALQLVRRSMDAHWLFINQRTKINFLTISFAAKPNHCLLLSSKSTPIMIGCGDGAWQPRRWQVEHGLLLA